jgi:hypothetical protein
VEYITDNGQRLVVQGTTRGNDAYDRLPPLERYQRMCRAIGVCSVCETGGYQPWNLDDSARCKECQP